MRLDGFRWASVLLVFGGLVVACAASEPVPPSREQMSALVNGNSEFAVDAYQRLRSSEGNLFFSPYSISTALALAYGGARGQTEQQIAKAAHFELNQNALHPAFGALQGHFNAIQERTGFKLVTANSLWPQQGYRFLDAYFTLAKEHYGVSITPVNYFNAAEAARKHINLWVENLRKWKKQAGPRKVDVFLPRFTMTKRLRLNDVLAATGMTDAFDPAAADFSGIADTRELFLDSVIHKAFIDVNEKGTEAAAATAELTEGSAPPPGPPVVFRADHPFLFLIQDDLTGTVLFLGRLTDPTRSGQ